MNDKEILNSLLKRRPKINYNKIDKKIRKKFGKEMDAWKIINKSEDIFLERGYFIRYIDLKLDKYSTALLLSCNFYNTGVLKSLFLKNVYNNMTWNITPQNYYIYKYTETNKSSLRKWLENIIENN